MFDSPFRNQISSFTADFQNTRLVVSSGTQPSDRSNFSISPNRARVPVPVRSPRTAPVAQTR